MQVPPFSPSPIARTRWPECLICCCVAPSLPRIRFVSSKRALAEPAAECLPALVVREKCDLLALAVAPSVRGPPAEVIDLLRTAKTSVLIWQPKQAQPMF